MLLLKLLFLQLKLLATGNGLKPSSNLPVLTGLLERGQEFLAELKELKETSKA